MPLIPKNSTHTEVQNKLGLNFGEPLESKTFSLVGRFSSLLLTNSFSVSCGFPKRIRIVVRFIVRFLFPIQLHILLAYDSEAELFDVLSTLGTGYQISFNNTARDPVRHLKSIMLS